VGVKGVALLLQPCCKSKATPFTPTFYNFGYNSRWGITMKSKIWVLGFVLSAVAVSNPPTGRYKDIVDKMNLLQAQYAKFSETFSIGVNDDGVEIFALRVSLTPKLVDPKKVGHIVVSTHHGNELAAPIFTMHFTQKLLERYNSDDIFRGSLAETEWTIIPVLNISGYNAANRNEKGYDPNRDYPGPCISSPGGKLKSIRTLMDHMKTRSYTGSLTVHGYVGALTYPWGMSTSNTHTNDHNAFESITAKAASYNGYRYGTSTDVVYPCEGAYEDYAYWKHGMWSLLLELRNGSDQDIRDTAQAIASYFDQLESSPSTKNQMTGSCTRPIKPDLHNE
jgi:carboxypeptidase T